MKTFYGNKYKDQCSLDQQAFDWVAPTASRGLRRLAYLFAALVLAVILAAWAYATPAGATPWTDENGNPNPDCTGSCHETGIPNPPEPPKPEPKPEPKQSHEGEPTGVLRCGCGYVVILRDGVSKAAAKRACEAAVPPKKECAK